MSLVAVLVVASPLVALGVLVAGLWHGNPWQWAAGTLPFLAALVGMVHTTFSAEPLEAATGWTIAVDALCWGSLLALPAGGRRVDQRCREALFMLRSGVRLGDVPALHSFLLRSLEEAAVGRGRVPDDLLEQAVARGRSQGLSLARHGCTGTTRSADGSESCERCQVAPRGRVARHWGTGHR